MLVHLLDRENVDVVILTFDFIYAQNSLHRNIHIIEMTGLRQNKHVPTAWDYSLRLTFSLIHTYLLTYTCITSWHNDSVTGSAIAVGTELYVVYETYIDNATQ